MAKKSARGWGIAVLLLAVAAGLAVWQMGEDAPETTQGAKIGGLLPFTGSLAAFGQSTLSGIELAVIEVNAAGGLLGGEFQLVTGDTETNPQAGVLEAQRLINVDGVSGIVGAMASGVTIPVALSVASVAGVAMISPSATSPAVTALEDGDFLFRTTPHDGVQGILLARLVTAQGIDVVAVLYRNDDYGRGLAEAFSVNYSGDITSIIGYEPDQPAYSEELALAASAGAVDALVMISFPEDGIPILREAIGQEYFDRFVFTDGMKANDVVEAVGQDYLESSFGIAPEAGPAEGLARYQAHYEANIGALPENRPFIENAYDGAILLALAIEQAGTSDPEEVRDALREVANAPGEVILPGEFARARELIAAGTAINYEGAAGSQDFDAAGDVSGTFGHWVFRNGAVESAGILDN